MRTSLILLLFNFLLISGCASSGTGLNIYSYQSEEEEGQKFAEEVKKQDPIMNDPKLDQYITHLGKMMIEKGVDDPHFDFTFNVVNSSEVNAFAIPGGHVYVNLALIKEATSEAEMIGVIGHEIGHVIRRHGTKRMTDALLLQVAAVGAESAISDQTSAQVAGVGIAFFGQAGLLMYGRHAELEADQTGVDILFRTGYDVQALPQFFKKLLSIEEARGIKGGGLSELLATHPPTALRIQKAEDYISTLQKQQNPKENSKEFDSIRRYVAPMTPEKSKLTSPQTS
jgi:predicted Zn-dependent protease